MDTTKRREGSVAPSAPIEQPEPPAIPSAPPAILDQPNVTTEIDKNNKDDQVGIDAKASKSDKTEKDKKTPANNQATQNEMESKTPVVKSDLENNSYEIGENTITMPLVYPSIYGDLDPDIASDILTETLAKISRRDDLVSESEMYTHIKGKTSVESERLAYRGITSNAYWDKYFPEGMFPRHPYHIHFDGGVVLHKLNPVLVEDYTRGGVVDTKMVASQTRGELPANRIVAEQIACLLNDSLVVFDLQYIYCIGHLMQFKIRDAELTPDGVVEWHTINETVEYIDMNPDQAYINDTIRAFTRAVTRQDIIMLAKSYSPEDINVMRMIATGTQSMTLSVRGRRHVADNFVSDQIRFVLIGTSHRDMPPFVAPTIDDISAFMHKFAMDFKTHFDGVKGYTKACSIYFGRVLIWRVENDQITSLCGPYTAPNDSSHQEVNFKMPSPVADGIPPQRARDKINHKPTFPITPAKLHVPKVTNRMAGISQSIREPPSTLPSVGSQETPNVNSEHVTILLDDTTSSEDSSTGPSNDEEEEVPKIVYCVDWLPASLEMGGTSIPQPHGFNILWRLLFLCDDVRIKPWMAREIKTWTSIPRNEINRLGAVFATMLTLGQSFSLHIANFTATQLRRYAAGDDTNSRGGLLFLLNSENVQKEPALIATNTCYFMARTFGLTMNPSTYYINRFSFSFIGPRQYPPGSAYELWCGDRMIYLQHPLSLEWMIQQFPSIWGISAPGVTVDLQHDVNLYLDNSSRGWYSDMGCKDYVTQFTDFLEFQHVPYAMAVLNALWQHYNLHGIPHGLHMRYYARAESTANLMREMRYLRLAWDPSTLSFAIGSLVTYDWDRKEVLALNISKSPAAQRIIRHMQDISEINLDAGYHTNRVIHTHIPNKTGLRPYMLGLFRNGRRNCGDAFSNAKVSDDSSSRVSGN